MAPLHHHCTTSHHPYLQPLPPSQENLILAELGLPDIPAQHKDAEQGQEHEEAEQGQEHEEEVADLLREAEQLYAAGMGSFKKELDYKRVLKWGDVLSDFDEAQNYVRIHDVNVGAPSRSVAIRPALPAIPPDPLDSPPPLLSGIFGCGTGKHGSVHV